MGIARRFALNPSENGGRKGADGERGIEMFDPIELYMRWQAARSQVQLWRSLGMDRKRDGRDRARGLRGDAGQRHSLRRTEPEKSPSHDQHLRQHVSHVVQFVGGERDLWRVPPKSVGGDRANLFGDHPAGTNAYAMDPAGAFDAGQRQHADEMIRGHVEVKA